MVPAAALLAPRAFAQSAPAPVLPKPGAARSRRPDTLPISLQPTTPGRLTLKHWANTNVYVLEFRPACSDQVLRRFSNRTEFDQLARRARLYRQPGRLLVLEGFATAALYPALPGTPAGAAFPLTPFLFNEP
jgi:hypothetical protein